jgi:hypothetical protein
MILDPAVGQQDGSIAGESSWSSTPGIGKLLIVNANWRWKSSLALHFR